jgi:hypothetical protein
VVVRDLGELDPERALARSDDAPRDADPVRVGDRGGVVEPDAELRQLGVEVRVERQLLRDDQRRDEDDVRAAVGGETTREVERVLGLPAAEQRHDDAAITDRGGTAREAARAATNQAKIGKLHRKIW